MAGEDVVEKVRRFLKEFRRIEPEAGKAFLQLVRATGSLSIGAKTAELVALGIAIAAGCEYCVRVHARRALEEGASCRELFDVAAVAILMRGGPALQLASLLLDFCGEEGQAVNTGQ
ncbi:MAG: carboxymuconolactone decarboxylase family protein [Crenarchaeota archaeon]|nr:carboxymuconolactone decarboxylase family protein [Thermoproteota archaeon]